ncbi:MAG: cytochrome c [Acidobacteriota bacterium]
MASPHFLSTVPTLLLLSFVYPAAAADDQVAYGKYLVDEVAKCASCHTPDGEGGKLDQSKYLQGKTLEVQPIAPIEHWHSTSPNITPSGRLWTRWGGAEAVKKYLMTGLTPSGKPAGAPMPAYTLKESDAAAIVAYLQTLK